MTERNCFLLVWLPRRAYGREEWEQGGSSRLRSESAAGAGMGGVGCAGSPTPLPSLLHIRDARVLPRI